MDMHNLLVQFATAIDAEIAEIEKTGREQTYELLSGYRDEKSTGTLYVFMLADALRLPADASGTLKVEGRDISAMVYSVEGNRIWLLLESVEELPEYLPSARLVINETDLLKRLREKIEALRSSGEFGLAPIVFGLELPHSRTAKLNSSHLDPFDADGPDGRNIIEKCVGSDVTYVWGPPGTGKTFTIAALVAIFAELEETVLVTSHTHAAVEQALWALVEPPSDVRAPGFLHGSPLIEDGKILKVGELKSEKIPRAVLRKVHLNSYLEEKAKERNQNIQILEQERNRTEAEVAEAQGQLRPWQVLHEAEELFRGWAEYHDQMSRASEAAAAQVAQARQEVSDDEAKKLKAERSFFIGRGGRVRRAALFLNEAVAGLTRALALAGEAEARAIKSAGSVNDAELYLDWCQSAVTGSPEEDELKALIDVGSERVSELEEEISALRSSAEDDAKNLVKNATAIFATLTKLYIDRQLLPDMKWDTVIVDEVSMAMPPLLAYAASLARKRVIVVGDMYQLPPVVNSDRDSEGGILATDVFEIAGITKVVSSGGSLPQLTMLTKQRRMHPDIAAGAKVLINEYADAGLTNHPDVLTRENPPFMNALGTDRALVVIDTSDLNPWSGKMPGSLSRFNFISGQAAVELAQLYAKRQDMPDESQPPAIGIVTPYAAQRRYLNQLIKTFGLIRWVMPGTVHTFQGNECDVIIFDSVVGHPHWTSRFTNPKDLPEVRRDLNVAITRAKHQFVFLGDSGWLRKNARSGTGFGKLWPYLNERAVHLTASEILGQGFAERVAKSIPEVKGWDLKTTDRAVFLTEADFYEHFMADLLGARERAILYTPFIGKTRWPQVAPAIGMLRDRRVDVFLVHKPLTDPEWRRGDPEFGRSVFKSLADIGVTLVPISGVHAKTIVIDSEIVYEGSLNWASQTSSYEHMWRFKSGDMAKLVERMLQLEPIVKAYGEEELGDRCPKCGGPLIVINQAQQNRVDPRPWKLGCARWAEDKQTCEGYLRPIDGRAPFLEPPACPLGKVMQIHYTNSGRPWDWRCGHKNCRPIRWARGDCEE